MKFHFTRSSSLSDTDRSLSYMNVISPSRTRDGYITYTSLASIHQLILFEIPFPPYPARSFNLSSACIHLPFAPLPPRCSYYYIYLPQRRTPSRKLKYLAARIRGIVRQCSFFPRSVGDVTTTSALLSLWTKDRRVREGANKFSGARQQPSLSVILAEIYVPMGRVLWSLVVYGFRRE